MANQFLVKEAMATMQGLTVTRYDLNEKIFYIML